MHKQGPPGGLDESRCVGPASERVLANQEFSLAVAGWRPSGGGQPVAVVVDRWRRKDRATGTLIPTARDGKGLRYLAHLRDPSGREVTEAFALKRDAQRWLDEQTAQTIRWTYVHPTAVKTTVGSARLGCPAMQPASRNRPASACAHRADHNRVRPSSLGSGSPVGCEVHDGQAEGRRPCRQLRLRAAQPAVAADERRRP